MNQIYRCNIVFVKDAMQNEGNLDLCYEYVL